MFSLYTYLQDGIDIRKEFEAIKSFEHFVYESTNPESWIKELHSMKQQREFISGYESQAIETIIGRYESLHQDFAAIQRKLSLPNIELPRLNCSSSSTRDYRKEYTAEMIDAVAKMFSEDIEYFEYSFHP